MSKQVTIVGAGLAGLTVARALQDKFQVSIIEASEQVGGRLVTKTINGFTLDRGFQVLFSAYPHANQLLDFAKLNLRAFANGALLMEGKGVSSKIEQPNGLDSLVEQAMSRGMSLGDKLRTLALRRELAEFTPEELLDQVDTSAEIFLKERGFSESFMSKFARPFFGGIFLDTSLQVSKNQFCFVWRMLAAGQTVVPAAGMQAIPHQLAQGLAPGVISTHEPVESIVNNGSHHAITTSQRNLKSDIVVLAADPATNEKLIGITPTGQRKSSTCYWFATNRPTGIGRFIALNSGIGRHINEVAELSSVAPEYAPAGKTLLAATVIGPSSPSAETIAQELAMWFSGFRASEFTLLDKQVIPYAQMPQNPGFRKNRPSNRTSSSGCYLASEATTNGSIDGAIQSGLQCAAAIIADHI